MEVGGTMYRDFGIGNWIASLVGALVVGVVQAAPVSFDFEEFSGSRPNALVTQGFVFDPGARDWVLGTPDFPDGPWIGHYHIFKAGPSYNGTNYFVFDYHMDLSTLNIYSTSDKVFGVKRLDLAEAGDFEDGECAPPADSPWRYEMLFTGYLEGGGTISLRAPLDMVCDGMGPKVDFETFEFDSHWSRLTMLTIAQLTAADTPFSYVGLDNLVLSTVSEPNSLALLSLVFAGVTFTRRRKR
jgi:hypothetical protein